MTTATLPSLRVEPEFRAEVESVLNEGETLSEFVEAAVRAGVQRRLQDAFVARGLQARDEARQSGDYVSAEAVLRSLRRSLDDARTKATARASSKKK